MSRRSAPIAVRITISRRRDAPESDRRVLIQARGGLPNQALPLQGIRRVRSSRRPMSLRIQTRPLSLLSKRDHRIQPRSAASWDQACQYADACHCRAGNPKSQRIQR